MSDRINSNLNQVHSQDFLAGVNHKNEDGIELPPQLQNARVGTGWKILNSVKSFFSSIGSALMSFGQSIMEFCRRGNHNQRVMNSPNTGNPVDKLELNPIKNVQSGHVKLDLAPDSQQHPVLAEQINFNALSLLATFSQDSNCETNYVTLKGSHNKFFKALDEFLTKFIQQAGTDKAEDIARTFNSKAKPGDSLKSRLAMCLLHNGYSQDQAIQQLKNQAHATYEDFFRLMSQRLEGWTKQDHLGQKQDALPKEQNLIQDEPKPVNLINSQAIDDKNLDKSKDFTNINQISDQNVDKSKKFVDINDISDLNVDKSKNFVNINDISDLDVDKSKNSPNINQIDDDDDDNPYVVIDNMILDKRYLNPKKADPNQTLIIPVGDQFRQARTNPAGYASFKEFQGPEISEIIEEDLGAFVIKYGVKALQFIAEGEGISHKNSENAVALLFGCIGGTGADSDLVLNELDQIIDSGNYKVADLKNWIATRLQEIVEKYNLKPIN